MPKLKSYEVCVTEKVFGSVYVEAMNEEEAKQKALEECKNGAVDFQGSDVEHEVGSVDETIDPDNIPF